MHKLGISGVPGIGMGFNLSVIASSINGVNFILYFALTATNKNGFLVILDSFASVGLIIGNIIALTIFKDPASRFEGILACTVTGEICYLFACLFSLRGFIIVKLQYLRSGWNHAG